MGRVLVVGRRCQCCVSSAYLAWLAKVMKDQCIHLLCTLQCHSTVPSWLAGWHTLKDQQSNHLALARCWLRHGWSQTREVLERRALDTAFNTTQLESGSLPCLLAFKSQSLSLATRLSVQRDCIPVTKSRNLKKKRWTVLQT